MCYPAEIEDIVFYPMIRVGSYLTCKIHCRARGVSYTSDFFLLTPLDKKANLTLLVYVDGENRERYAMECFRQTSGYWES